MDIQYNAEHHVKYLEARQGLKKTQLQVRKWSEKFGQCVAETPTIPSLEVRKLRAKLILEEALKTMAGLGFSVYELTSQATVIEICLPDLKTVADGIAASIFVQLGTAVACGIDMEPIFDEVCRSNMSKLWTCKEYAKRTDSSLTYEKTQSLTEVDYETTRCYLVKDSHGKVIKSPSYSPAKIVL